MHKFLNVSVNICWKLLVVHFERDDSVMSVVGLEEAVYEEVRLSQQLRPQERTQRVSSEEPTRWATEDKGRGELCCLAGEGFVSSLLPGPMPNSLCCSASLGKTSMPA